MRTSIIVGIAVVAAWGCTGRGHLARSRAANDFDCEEHEVEVQALGANGYRAVGCGRTRDYVCRGRTCVSDSAMAETGPRPTGQPEELTRALVAETHAAVRACAPGADLMFVSVESDGTGRIVPLAVPGSPAESQCSRRALGAASDPRWAGLGQVSLRYVPELAQPTAAASPATPPVPIEPPSLRPQLDSRSGAILGCAGGSVATVNVEWSADGAITGSLRGREGSPEDSCVRAILSRERVSPPPGTAGSLLHVVEAR